MEIRLLGPVAIHGPAGVVRLRRAGERCVLAALAFAVGQPVAVTTLVDHLWLPAEQSDKSIETVGSYARKVRSALRQAGGTPGVLRYDRAAHTYVLAVDPDQVDYRRFTELAADARRTGNPAALADAVRLWHGPALAGVAGHWADHRRHTLDAELLAAHEDLLQLQLVDGRYESVAAAAADLVQAMTPTDRLLLLGARGLAGSGRHTAIRAWVARVTSLMRQTIDAAPSSDVLDGIERLITGATTRSAPPTSVPAATAMFGMRADISTFTGRTDELRDLVAAVDTALDNAAHAIAVHAVDGMAGVGKTAFGVHAAHHLAGRFPDGSLFLELHGHTPGRRPVPPADALDSLLRAAGVPPAAIPPRLEDRSRLWRDRMAGRRILLVLDDAAGHDQLRPLMPGPGGSLVLITSRHRLPALDGATSLTLEVLPPEASADLLVKLAGRPAEHVDRRAVAEIVARCGYLPLAIALAGAQLRTHPRWTPRFLADLLAEEHHRLEHLRAGDRSVAAAFGMSFRQLPADRQRVFRLLGRHPGPEVDAHALARLADITHSEARHQLEALYADHLVQETAPNRYQLHDLVRAYAHQEPAPTG